MDREGAEPAANNDRNRTGGRYHIYQLPHFANELGRAVGTTSGTGHEWGRAGDQWPWTVSSSSSGIRIRIRIRIPALALAPSGRIIITTATPTSCSFVGTRRGRIMIQSSRCPPDKFHLWGALPAAAGPSPVRGSRWRSMALFVFFPPPTFEPSPCEPAEQPPGGPSLGDGFDGQKMRWMKKVDRSSEVRYFCAPQLAGSDSQRSESRHRVQWHRFEVQGPRAGATKSIRAERQKSFREGEDVTENKIFRFPENSISKL